MFEQTFKNIDDILHKDAGCGSELDYVEQTSWILFLKYLDDLEKDRATAAELTGKKYSSIIQKEFQWPVWVAPKTKDGKTGHHKAMSGDDLTEFVNNKLFPYLKKFKSSAASADTIEYKIGEIFSELKNSGYNCLLKQKRDWIEHYLFSFPKSKEQQQTIVRQLDALRAETQKLEAVHQKKLDDLEELKKSILQKAFAGELTQKAVTI